MLLAEDGEQSLLYTGDFKLGESATAERAELPQADILVIESTYGNPDLSPDAARQTASTSCSRWCGKRSAAGPRRSSRPTCWAKARKSPGS